MASQLSDLSERSCKWSHHWRQRLCRWHRPCHPGCVVLSPYRNEVARPTRGRPFECVKLDIEKLLETVAQNFGVHISDFRAASAAIPAAEALGPAATHEKLDLGVLFTNKLPIRIRDRIPTLGDRALICP